MAQFDFGLDILRNVVRRSGEILPTTTDETVADHLIDVKLYINAAYWEVCALKPWRWARKRAQFASIAETTGTVTMIAGTSVTLSATIATTMVDRKFVLDSDGIPHRISAHTAGSDTLTLQASYTGTGTSGSFTIFQDEIPTGLTDILAFPMLSEMHWGDTIRVVPEGEMTKTYPRNIYGTERAFMAAFISDSILRIAPWTKAARLFELSYNRRPAALDFAGSGAGDTPIVPQDSRIAIAQRTLMRLFGDKRDERLEIVKGEFDETLSRMSATESTFGKPRIWAGPSGRVGV